ncbi:MAG: hypothetical protein A2277_14240 [Desulfobacterales bacterium RIFOXYA12_FULL_46_15]|nr:MAG: hypothetical protein A2277_14240 [Desulfobacterales bacterium RIFOXYA12_FULL_46_15]
MKMPLSHSLEKNGREPAYIRICNSLKDRIAEGVYVSGDRLPSESELCRLHKVSPMTIRRSIRILLDQGIVTTVQGSGTFVRAPHLNQVTFSLKEFFDIFKDEKRTQVKLMDVCITKADDMVSARLQIEPGQRVILLQRLILRDGDPVIYHREFLVYDPARPVIEADLEITTLYGLFEGRGQAFLKRGEMTVEAMVLDPELAGHLNTQPLLPAFRLEHLFYDFDDHPVSWGRFICRGDVLRFKATVGFGISGQKENHP